MKIINLQKRLGAFNLDIENLELESGCIHGFMGDNGSGKTTAAKLIAGILKPDKGEIQYGGLTPRDITMILQKPYMLHTTVYENLIYPLKIRRIKPDDTEIDNLLKEFELFDKKRQYARTLSSGEQQKLAFLRAVIFKPKLVIVDETLSNLSGKSLELSEDIILKSKNITWIIVSHQPNIISNLCDNIHFFSNGRIIESGKKEKVLFNSDDPTVKAYMKKQAFEITR